jgi:hypothetical protein
LPVGDELAIRVLGLLGELSLAAADLFGLSSPFGGDSSVRKGDLDAGAAEVDHRDERVGGVEAVGAV